MKIVIAIGGNAILNPVKSNIEEQQKRIDETCREIAQIIMKGYDVVLTHGNGPQIGNILAMQEECAYVHPQPMDVCGAQTQGWLGYLLQQSLNNRLKEIGIKKRVVTLLTQVIVDELCDSFKKPTKPVGLYYSKYKAQRMMAKGIKMIKDEKGYRRVVPSPIPKAIVEEEAIRKLVSEGYIVIAAGGGGIPVIMKNGLLTGVEAVVDKDLTASLLASKLKAEVFLILTDVEKVSLNYGKRNQIELEEIRISEAERYLNEGHFGKGNMEPKIASVINFIKNGGKEAIISSLEKAIPALEGMAGTRIIP